LWTEIQKTMHFALKRISMGFSKLVMFGINI
jgi:hypothetical protein